MTQIRHPGQELLNGRQRGYKQPGKRLLPRDAHEAAEIRHYKLHGRRDFQRCVREQQKAYEAQYAREQADCRLERFDPFEGALRKLKALSGRNRRLAETLSYGNGAPPRGTPRSILRVVQAMERAERVALCIRADERLLANAY